jgi:predicted HTH domain antitoxin
LEWGALTKKVLADGLTRERLQFAIQKYVLHEISMERAAEIAKVSLHELLRVFENLGIPSNLTEVDLRELLSMES